MNKQEAKRITYVYVLGVLTNFHDAFDRVLEDHAHDPQAAAQLEAAMETFLGSLKRVASAGRHVRSTMPPFRAASRGGV